MEINSKIFKAYDIRGSYPKELDENSAYLIGRAFARRAGAKKVTVGCDMRLSGSALKKAFINGITGEGINVKDIGLVPVDAVYYMVGKMGDEAGVMITASHNPKDDNGFKMVLKNMGLIDSKDLLEEIKVMPEKLGSKKGEVEQVDIIASYINHVLSFVDVDKIKPFKVVVDAGNGMAGKIIPLLTESLPVNVVALNFKLDGNFPAHPSNPLLPESQKEIREAVIKEKADFGVIFDGDTDRLCFVDEKGNFISADITLLLLAKMFLEKEPGASIAYTLNCSKIVPEAIEKFGGKALATKIGYNNIWSLMRQTKAVLGGELSSHYSFRENGYSDSGFIAFVVLLQTLSGYSQSFSEIVKPFYKYFKSPEINSQVKDKEAVIEKIKQKYSDGKQNLIDGIRVDYKDWWFLVRPSNTEPLLRLTIEADAKDLLDEKIKELSKIIK